MIKLRPYQNEIKLQVYNAWASGYKGVLLVLPTGMGKTKTFCSLVIETNLTTAIVVHRKELVQQICLTLAEEEIPHNIIASRQDIRGIIASERRMFNKSFYNPHSKISVISVDTLIARQEHYRTWAESVQQWVTDEAAHLLADNKWGRAVKMFVNARGLGVTATPERLDKKGLGSHVDGVFDIMVQGPPTRWGIDNGFLSKYKIVVPPSDYNQHLITSSDTSDYSKKAMMDASNKSHIVGDVVDNYLKFAKGKSAILFATDTVTAHKMEKQFIEKGVIAKALDSNSLDTDRLDSLIKFKNKEIHVLLNVDLFDEGLDVPGIEVVIMGRPTKSLGKFLQMCGRGLRPAKEKPYSLIIDHVGNIEEHGLPCDIRKWTLDRVAKRGVKLNFIRICSNITCNVPYDKVLTACPWCGTEPIKASNGGGGGKLSLKQVDGDLYLLDPEQLRDLQSKAVLEDPAVIAHRVSKANPAAALRAMKNQQERIAVQKQLSESIAMWAGYMKKQYGYSDREIHKRFYLEHNITITEALAEPAADMKSRIEEITWRSK